MEGGQRLCDSAPGGWEAGLRLARRGWRFPRKPGPEPRGLGQVRRPSPKQGWGLQRGWRPREGGVWVGCRGCVEQEKGTSHRCWVLPAGRPCLRAGLLLVRFPQQPCYRLQLWVRKHAGQTGAQPAKALSASSPLRAGRTHLQTAPEEHGRAHAAVRRRARELWRSAETTRQSEAGIKFKLD